MDWLTMNLFPNWVQNLSIIATLASTVLTFCVWKKTNTLYKIYNKKTSIFYIVDKVNVLWIKYNDEIKNISKPNSFSENEKQTFWSMIKEINASIITYEITDKDIIGTHMKMFKSNTEELASISKDKLTYDNIWNYYDHLTRLHHALGNIKEMDVRKLSSNR